MMQENLRIAVFGPIVVPNAPAEFLFYPGFLHILLTITEYLGDS